jgi:Ca2+/H+ antiporter
MGKPLSLLFDPLEVLILFLSVLLVRFATEDGRTHYMRYVLNACPKSLQAYHVISYTAASLSSEPVSHSVYRCMSFY